MFNGKKSKEYLKNSNIKEPLLQADVLWLAGLTRCSFPIGEEPNGKQEN